MLFLCTDLRASVSLLSRASTTAAVLATLDGKINSIAADTAAAKLNQQEHERQLQANLKEVHERQKEKSLGGGMASRRAAFQVGDRENMSMDVDEQDTKGKNRKYVIRLMLRVHLIS
jgi:COP9 signalosome complex subunit 7